MAASGRGASGLASAPSRTPTPSTRIYYNPELSRFSLGDDHPMVPHRLHLTHRLVELWGLLDDPAVTLVSDYSPVTTEELRRFHTAEYVAFLEYLDSLDLERLSVEEQQKLLGDDLAMFGLSVCRLSTGGAGGEGAALGGAEGTGADDKSLARTWAVAHPSQVQADVKEHGGSAAQAAGAGQPVDGQTAGPGATPDGAESSVNPAMLNLAVLLLQRLMPNCTGQLTVAQRVKLVEILRAKEQLLRNAPSAGGQSLLGFSLQALAHAAEQSIAVPEEDQLVQPGAGSGAGVQPGPAARKRPASAQGGGGGKAGKGAGGQRRPQRSRRRLSLSSSEEESDGGVVSEEEPPEEVVQVAAVQETAGGRPLRSRGRGGSNPTLAAIIAAEAADVEASDSEVEDDEEEEDSDDEGGDCPIFPGLLKYVGLQAAGSLLAAKDLAAGLCDIAVHWGGGMHHGMPYRAFGFCYVNDLVLAVLELMAGCGRVLYIDIDIHHGDGVETAFQRTDKVLSISLHKWDDGKMQASLDTLEAGSPRRAVFFPGTGKKNDLGEGRGKYFTINVPLQDNITDESYLAVYEPVIRTAFERFKPQAVVLQCGCDSVAGDKLGRFNLSIRGHSKCVQVVSDLCYEGFGGGGRAPAGGDPAHPDRRPVPLLVTGGGGYTPPLVARCWALETAVLLGRELGEVMPRAAAEAPDLRDLGPPYFRDGSELARPPSAPYAMCLDTTWRPSSHKQMDSEYSLSRLTTYLTSNLQRIRLSPDGDDGAKSGGGAAAAGERSREGGAAGPGRAAEGGATAAGVDNPEQFLTDPEQYPDALDYIQDQQERVAESAPWARFMPEEAVAAALEAAGGARAAAGSPAPEDKKKEQKGKKDSASGKQQARGGSAAAEDAKAKAAAASGKGKKSGSGTKEPSKPPQSQQRQQKKEAPKSGGAAAAAPAAAAALAALTQANPQVTAALRALVARSPQMLQILLANQQLRNQLLAALRARPPGQPQPAPAAAAAGAGAVAAAPAAMPGLPMIQPYQPGNSSAAAAVAAAPDTPSPAPGAAGQEQEPPPVPPHPEPSTEQADGVNPGQ